jgi:hypothetical protein
MPGSRFPVPDPVYTLHLTRALLDQFDPADPEDDPGEVAPTTRLGDWFVMPMDAGGRHLLLCTSDKSLLSVVFPADHLDELPEQLVTALVGVLHRLGAPRESIVAEVDAMTIGRVGPARRGSTLGAMRGLATRARRWLMARPGDVDVAALYGDLALYRNRALGAQTAGARALELLRVPAPRTRGQAGQAGGRRKTR